MHNPQILDPESQIPRLVPAVDRAARIFEALAAAGRGMTISELARELGINKGTMRDLLETLRVHGLLERDEVRKEYRLGTRLARLGMAALGQLDLAAVARPFLVDLANRVHSTVLLLVPHGDRATIVDKVDAGRMALEVSATIGQRIRLAAGACGKIFLAYSRDADPLKYLADLAPTTARTITDSAQYAAELERVRTTGYALDDEEYLWGVRAASAPVFDGRGQIVAAVLVVGLTASLQVADLPAIGVASAEAGRGISLALGAHID